MNEYGALVEKIHREKQKHLEKNLSNTDIVYILHGMCLDLTVV